MSKAQNERDREPEARVSECKSGECGIVHGDCCNSWKGTCDREAGHGGSHHCSSCNSAF